MYEQNAERFSKRTKYEVLKAQLRQERSTFESHWRDLGDHILPRRPRFYTTDVNKGERRNLKIYDTTATYASRVLRSGLMSGVTSPARPWFKLGMPDPSLNTFTPVKDWLHLNGERMRDAFIRSNLYNVLPTVYGDMGTFATGALFMDEDPNMLFRFYALPIGSYWIGSSNGHSIDIYFREFNMTVRNIVNKFAKKNAKGKIIWDDFSSYIRNLWENNHKETWVTVNHIVMPNEKHRPDSPFSKHKRFTSVYYDLGGTGSGNGLASASSLAYDNDKVLSEKGYDYFPVLVPRWEVSGEDWYGTDCPGMTALGDVRQLQLGERRSAQAIEKQINPAMVGPASLRNAKASILPGDITYISDFTSADFRPAHQVNLDIGQLESKQQQIRNRINQAYYVDLFLMLSQSDRRQITAREIEERHEEKLLALGPVLEQLNQDLLDPLIDNAFTIMAQRELITDPPEEIQGQDIKVEYISVMAQAQKLIGIGAIERFMGFYGNIASQDPMAAKKVDRMQVLDTYADFVGVTPGIIVPTEQVLEEVEQERQAQAQAQEQEMQMQQMQQAAATAKDLSGASLEGRNALSELEDQAQAGDLLE